MQMKRCIKKQKKDEEREPCIRLMCSLLNVIYIYVIYIYSLSYPYSNGHSITGIKVVNLPALAFAGQEVRELISRGANPNFRTASEMCEPGKEWSQRTTADFISHGDYVYTRTHTHIYICIYICMYVYTCTYALYILYVICLKLGLPPKYRWLLLFDHH